MDKYKTIRIGRLHELTGEGTEYLLSEYGEIIAEFFNGNFARPLPSGNIDDTIVQQADNNAA